MQENLLFFGIPETDIQNPTDRTQNQRQNESHNDNSEPTLNRNETKQAENTEEVLRNFIANDLPAHVSRMASDIRFDRVHRLGARKRGRTNPRPIIAKFERYSDREIVRKAGMDLNSNPYTKYKVREQFAREIEEHRKLHKFVSPLSDQNSPKKQRDIGLYLNKADQPPLIQEIVNVVNAVTSTDTDNIHTEDRDITDLNATNEVLNGQFSEPTSISETLRETRETMDTTDIQTGSSGQAEQGCA